MFSYLNLRELFFKVVFHQHVYAVLINDIDMWAFIIYGLYVVYMLLVCCLYVVYMLCVCCVYIACMLLSILSTC